MWIAGKISSTVRYLMLIASMLDAYFSAVDTAWHTSFDDGQWILLPDAATLAEVYGRIKLSIAWRRDSAADCVEDFMSKVHAQ